MLINRKIKYEKDEVVGFKIVNGDEVVARIVEDIDDCFMVDKPVTLVPSQQGLAMMQSMFSMRMDKTIPILKKNVIMHCVVRDDVETGYLETTTGIQQVKKQGIIV